MEIIPKMPSYNKDDDDDDDDSDNKEKLRCVLFNFAIQPVSM